MCLAKAYSNAEEEPLLENVAHLRFEGEKLIIETLFGEAKVLNARIREIDFVKSRIALEKQG